MTLKLDDGFLTPGGRTAEELMDWAIGEAVSVLCNNGIPSIAYAQLGYLLIGVIFKLHPELNDIPLAVRKLDGQYWYAVENLGQVKADELVNGGLWNLKRIEKLADILHAILKTPGLVAGSFKIEFCMITHTSKFNVIATWLTEEKRSFDEQPS
jgi:hypothetical protein